MLRSHNPSKNLRQPSKGQRPRTPSDLNDVTVIERPRSEPAAIIANRNGRVAGMNVRLPVDNTDTTS